MYHSYLAFAVILSSLHHILLHNKSIAAILRHIKGLTSLLPESTKAHSYPNLTLRQLSISFQLE